MKKIVSTFNFKSKIILQMHLRDVFSFLIFLGSRDVIISSFDGSKKLS